MPLRSDKVNVVNAWLITIACRFCLKEENVQMRSPLFKCKTGSNSIVGFFDPSPKIRQIENILDQFMVQSPSFLFIYTGILMRGR